MAQYYHYKIEPVCTSRFACVGKYSVDDPKVGKVILRDHDAAPMLYFEGKRWEIAEDPPLGSKTVTRDRVLQELFFVESWTKEFITYADSNPDHHAFVMEIKQDGVSDEVHEIKIIPIVEDRIGPAE